MPKYTRVEFIIYLKKATGKDDKEAIKKGQAFLSVNASRNKLVIDTEGTINTSHPVNKAFVEQYWANNPELQQHIPHASTVVADYVPPVPPVKQKPQQISYTTEDAGHVPEDDDDLQTMDAGKLAQEKVRAYIQKTRSATRLDEIKIQKQEGLLIPTEDMKTVIPILAKTILIACENAFERFITDISAKYNMSSQDFATYRSKIPTLLTQASTEAVDNALKDIDNIITETADVRGRGEKK